MANIDLTYAGVDYLDRTRTLIDGTTRPGGISLRYVVLPPSELFRRVAQDNEFDAAEMSTATYMNLLSRGDDRYVGIPVFPSRNFRHGYIFVHRDSGIKEPKDLVGRKIGVSEYQMTAAVWQRAALMYDYGVMPKDIRWFQGAEWTAGYLERNAIPDPPGVSIQMIPPEETLQAMLARGELDGLLSPNRPPTMLDGSGRVRRLFPNWVEVEQEYYQRTGLFPIMHMVVIQRRIYEKYPWVAMSLYDAFVEAQRVSWTRLLETGSLGVMLPWLPHELEQIQQIMGPGHWPYGLQANRKVLEALCQYHFEQGLSTKKLKPEDLFAPETHGAPTLLGPKRYSA
jgi:4,5-dihydroxyphthalate decarboxylase